MSEELETKLDLELDEAKATGEDSENMDPVTPAGGSPKGKNRKADKNQSVDPNADNIKKTVKAPQGPNNTGLKEAFAGLFDGEGLSEDFKTKTVAVFEAAVHEKVLSERAALEEKFEADLAEQVTEAVDDLVEKVDTYLNYVIENWMEENSVAVESNIKVEVAESLLVSIKGLVAEHNLSIDEQERDLVAEMEEMLDEQRAKYNEVVEEVMALKEDKKQLELTDAFKSISEGLTETQVEKLSVLAEGVSFQTVGDYTKKLEAIKENYFTESLASFADDTELLEEAVEEVAVKASVDPSVARYVDSIGRLAK
jgi:hypothetical protein